MKFLKLKKGSIVSIALFSITFILAFLIMRNIPLFGDDYYYVTFKSGDFWQMHKDHYLLANGRAIVHFLVTVFIALPPIFWQILNSALLATIICVIANFFNSEKAKYVVTFAALGMFMALGTDMVRESIYWLTGSFNYVYPFAILVVYWYLLCKKEGCKTYILCILAFLSSATTEQNGMMTFGLTLLYILDIKFIRKEKINKKYFWVLAIALLGFCSVYFAPATFVRYGLETEQGILDIIKGQLPLLYYNFISKSYMLPYVIFTLLATGLYNFKHSNRFAIKIVSLLNIPAICLVLYISNAPYTKVSVWAAIVGFTLIFGANILLIFLHLLKSKASGYFIICTALILAIGSQFMMSASPVSGPRTMLCGVLCLMIFNIGIISLTCDNKNFFTASLILSLALCVIGTKIYINNYIGYKENYPVTEQNETLIDEFKQNPQDKLTQYTLPYPDHCWSMPYQSTYHLYHYKNYYGLSQYTKINWVEYKK